MISRRPPTDDLGILRGLDDAEEGVHAGLADAFRLLVAEALFEDRRSRPHLVPLLPERPCS